MKASDRKPSAKHPAATRLDEAETESGVLSDAMNKKHHRAHHAERDLTDMPGDDRAGEDSEVTPEPAQNLEADIVAADDVGDGTCRVTINRGTDDNIYPWVTGILGGKDGAQFSVRITKVSERAATAIVDTTYYMIQHHSTMTVILNPGTAAKPAKPHSHHRHKHHDHHD